MGKCQIFQVCPKRKINELAYIIDQIQKNDMPISENRHDGNDLKLLLKLISNEF